MRDRTGLPEFAGLLIELCPVPGQHRGKDPADVLRIDRADPGGEPLPGPDQRLRKDRGIPAFGEDLGIPDLEADPPDAVIKGAVELPRIARGCDLLRKSAHAKKTARADVPVFVYSDHDISKGTVLRTEGKGRILQDAERVIADGPAALYAPGHRSIMRIAEVSGGLPHVFRHRKQRKGQRAQQQNDEDHAQAEKNERSSSQEASSTSERSA